MYSILNMPNYNSPEKNFERYLLANGVPSPLNLGTWQNINYKELLFREALAVGQGAPFAVTSFSLTEEGDSSNLAIRIGRYFVVSDIRVKPSCQPGLANGRLKVLSTMEEAKPQWSRGPDVRSLVCGLLSNLAMVAESVQSDYRLVHVKELQANFKFWYLNALSK